MVDTSIVAGEGKEAVNKLEEFLEVHFKEESSKTACYRSS